MNTFNELELPQAMLHCLQKLKFDKPTPIQAKAIPLALQGRDILGSAQTGTGKTAAFSIPMIAYLIQNRDAAAIVMTPTRELATQVLAAVESMLPPSSKVKTALLIGGSSMGKQLQQLRARPRIVIGTPGRINDHLQQGTLRLSETSFLVLDETDRMLDMGFEVQIDRIVSRLPKKRQTLLFSATLPPHIVKMADKYQHRPERIAVGSAHVPVDRIRQELFHLKTSEKYDKLIEQLNVRTGSIIVFVKTKRGADRIALKLSDAKHKAEAIHGNLSQNKRNAVIQGFRDKKFRIMVATDVAARGLDIPHIEHVINYDLPQVPEDYIHRIGRTARAGAEGSAACFITPEDKSLWRDIHILMHPDSKTEKEENLPRRSYGERPESRGDKFAKRDFKPREFEKREARHEGDRSKGFKKRSEGGFKKPRHEDGEFRKPREESDFKKPRREGDRFEKPREGGFKKRPDGEFRKPREDGEFRKPREDGDRPKRREDGEFRKPRREGDRFQKPREGERSERPRREGDRSERRGGGGGGRAHVPAEGKKSFFARKRKRRKALK